MSKITVNKALLKAKSHAKRGELDEAKNLYQSVLRIFPHNKQAQRGLDAINKSSTSFVARSPDRDALTPVINLYTQGRFAAVIERAEKLAMEYPISFLVWNILGAAAAQAGQLDKAIFAFQRAIALEPNNADVHSNIGSALKDKGRLDEAIASYERALSLNPDHADALNNMGRIHWLQRDFKSAFQLMEYRWVSRCWRCTRNNETTMDEGKDKFVCLEGTGYR